MYDEVKDKKAKCPSCQYEYDGKYEAHRQDVLAVIEDGACTWCYAYEVEKKLKADEAVALATPAF